MEDCIFSGEGEQCGIYNGKLSGLICNGNSHKRRCPFWIIIKEMKLHRKQDTY